MRYIKTVPIEAEQFDCSQELMDKYHITVGLCYIKTLEGVLQIHVSDWITTGVNGKHLVIADEIFKQTYKPVKALPQMILDSLKDKYMESDTNE